MRPGETYLEWLRRVNHNDVEDVTAEEAARINAAWAEVLP
jgi:hypothetical protein